MTSKDIRISATEGGGFDCYLALPESGPAPAIVLCSSVFGVDDDARAVIDDLAARGFVAAGPDLFWRTDPGGMPRTEEGGKRARVRGQPRHEVIERGVQDVADTIAHLKSLPQCNGKIAVVGLCYGAPYAILGATRLDIDAGIAFHGTKVEDYIDQAKGITIPLVFHWGDKDHAAPPEALEKIRAAVAGMKNVEIVVYPGIEHGYSQKSSASWDEAHARKSWDRAIEVVGALRDTVTA